MQKILRKDLVKLGKDERIIQSIFEKPSIKIEKYNVLLNINDKKNHNY